MKEKTQKYFSIFLIFLLASTEFSVGKAIPESLQKQLDDFLHEAKELNTLQHGKSREKRK